jgi:Tfp pilus assembly protein PilN
LVSVPIIILGTINYNNVRTETLEQIEERLEDQAHEIHLFVDGVYNAIEHEREIVEHEVRTISTEQAKIVYEMLQLDLSNQEILDSLSNVVIGKTGYIWIVDYQGNYVLSKKPAKRWRKHLQCSRQ